MTSCWLVEFTSVKNFVMKSVRRARNREFFLVTVEVRPKRFFASRKHGNARKCVEKCWLVATNVKTFVTLGNVMVVNWEWNKLAFVENKQRLRLLARLFLKSLVDRLV